MTEPTDDEILEAVKHLGAAMLSPVEVARAVLAKWGTPPAVAGEPVGEFDQMRGRLVILEGAPMFKHRQKVYTTPQPTQAQAGAVPLTNARLQDISLDYSDSEDECTGFRDGWRAAEKHFGIKGGQHGADT